MFEAIKRKFEKTPVYKTENGYDYFVYPYKGIIPIDIEEVRYLAEAMYSKMPKDIDLIFTVETDGIFTALPLALLSGKPIVAARTFNYKMTDLFQFTQETGYQKRELFFSFDLTKIKRIVIVDCILSTGGTLRAAENLFRKLGVEVVGIYVVANKLNYSNTEFIDQINDKLFSFFDVEIVNGSLVVNRSKYYR
ncbi:MAG: phosphoribosyltransferase family protein [Candidatus Paceibacterota bacterium]|jgi:adenine phosphoribosyltransferase